MTKGDEQMLHFLAAYEGLTRRRYAAALTQFATWYQQIYRAAPDAALLTAEEVRAYRNALSARGLQAATVNVHLAALRGQVRSCGRAVRVKGVRRVLPAIAHLNGRELGRLLAVAAGDSWQAKRNVALLTLLARAGLRVSEALAVTLGDIEMGERSGQVLVKQGKGLKERVVPLSKEARVALAVYLAVRPTPALTDCVFLTRSRGALTSRDAQRIVTQAARQAGIAKKVTPHTLRHTFATRFLEANPGDLATLSRLLGHASTTTTLRYLHPRSEQVQAMIEGL